MNVHQHGSAINLVQEFLTVDPITAETTPADPSTVTFKVEDPAGNVVEYVFGTDPNVTNPEVGTYVCLVGPYVEPGVYIYEVVGSGGGVDVTDPGAFEIAAGGVLVAETADVAQFGPCQPWTTGEEIVACGADLGLGDDTWKLDNVAAQASALLFVASGRAFPGECSRKVRPCNSNCSCWTDDAVTGWLGVAGGWGRPGGGVCGCGALSSIPLPGLVRSILEVKIDGAVLPELDDDDRPNWRLDYRRELVRMDLPGTRRRWPSCQNLSLPDSDPGTFSIRYTWGADPPVAGRAAAARLARELWIACGNGEGKCALPTKVTQVVRQGVTINNVATIAALIRRGSTGVVAIDAFIAAVNPDGARRASLVWSPDLRQFPRVDRS